MGLSIAETVAVLTRPGAPFEMEMRQIGGIPTRVWKNAPPSLRAVFEASHAHGDLPFLVYEGERLSYAEHYQRAAALARALAGRFAVRKGDRIAIAMRNLPEWVTAFWAATSIGAIAVPLNAWFTGGELEYCLADAGPVVLIADAERAPRLLPHLAGLQLRATIVARGEGDPPPLLRFEDVIAGEQGGSGLPPVAIEPDDDATIFYTSGTTGKPKGALGTHRNICTNILSAAYGRARAKLRNGEALSAEPLPKKSMLLTVPLFHVTGCHSGLVANFYAGNKIVLMRKWDPEKALALIERERITSFGGVPAFPWQIIESPAFGRHDLSSVETVSYGGAPSAPELVTRIQEAFPAAQPSNGYGLTETSAIACQNLADDYRQKPASAGLMVPVCDAKIVDAAGLTLPVGEIGELWIKGPNVVKGYWRNQPATAAAITDGWLHSGDLAKIDEEGFVYILDRAKDMIIRGGENIYCIEVEDALYSHPAVMDAAVVGIPHRILGEEVGALVQLTPGGRITEGELKAYLSSRLASFKLPVRIEFQDMPLPRNANGKILKRELRARFLT